MKHKQLIMTCFFLALGVLSGCSKDEITDTRDKNKTNTENSGSGGSTEIDGSDDDYIANSSFDHTVSITFSTSGDATVTGASDNISVSVRGNGITINNTGDDVVRYEVSGNTTDGFLKIYSGKKQAIILNSVDIANSAGAAINIQGPANTPAKGKRTFIVVNGNNKLTDGKTYNTPSAEDEKGVIFSEGKLAVSGTGALTITAQGKSAIASDDYVRFLAAPTINIYSTAGHGVKANDGIIVDNGIISVSVSSNMKKGFTSNDYVTINGGTTTINVTGSAAYDNDEQEYIGTAGIKADSTFTITAGTLTVTNSGTGGKGISSDGRGYFNGGTISVTATGSNYGSSNNGGGFGPGGRKSDNTLSSKAIKFDGNLYFAGATVTAKASAHEAIESKGAIEITAGEVYAYSSDDAMNSAKDFTISGGHVCGYSTGNDGLDANGNFYIKGGVVYAIGARAPEVAVDANTEGGYRLYVTGGTIIAIGGLENGASLAQNCYSATSWSSNTSYGLTIGDNIYAFKTPASGGSGLVVSGESTPTLSAGVSVTGGTSYCEGMLTLNPSLSGGSSVSLNTYSGGGNNGGGPGGNGGGPRGR
ncbi:MAG: carbohydrate-binding domain-containing protein [Bacteroidales bacterium]|nr:carbohydrate-binding domain-containing protein [Bacteroidales bacterium]